MDWNEKFNSIVKETEENLAKAKEKLTGKASTPRASTASLAAARPKTTQETKFFHYSDSQRHRRGSALSETDEIAMNSSRSTNFQVLHMQDQIDSQNRTIDGLQQLVRSLNNERTFYKEQIAQLKNEVEGLGDKLSSQVAMATTDRHLSGVKREVMAEVDRLRRLVHSQAEMNRRPASEIGSEFWTVKETLTDNLEQIRLELNVMNKRIDRMESRITSDSSRIQNQEFQDLSSKNSPSLRSSLTPLYTPTSSSLQGLANLDIQNMKSTISALNSKLDNIEKKVETPPYQNSTPLYSSLRSSARSRKSRPLSPDRSHVYRKLPDDIEDDLISDLSDFSDIDIDDLSDLDVDNENEDIGNKTSRRDSSRRTKSSIYKPGRHRKSKVEFDLSDLDLSDLEEGDLRDTDSLDLDM